MALPPSEAFRRWAEANPEAAKAKNKRYHTKLRKDVIEGYGGVCVCCGSTYLPHLTLDHINGGGRQQRMTQKSSSKDTYRILRRMLPALDPEFQIMCYNCNSAKHILGECGCQEGQ